LAAKQQRLEHLQQAKAGPTATPPQPLPKDGIKDEIAANKDAPAAKDTPAANAEAASK
jgi:hypothetical protein